MRVVLCSAYPLADRHYHRKLLLHELLKLRDEGIISHLHLVYSGIMPADYLAQFQRMGSVQNVLSAFGKVAAKPAPKPHTTDVVLPRGFTWSYARAHKVNVSLFRRYGDSASLEWFDEHKIDLAINLSGLYLPKKLLEKPRLAFQGGHYGVLPALRGGDTVRWSIYTNQPLILSHMTLAAKMDMGDILRRETLPVYRSDSIDDLRKRCQMAAVAGHVECVRRWADGSIEREVQREEDGQIYYLMGERLRRATDQRIKEGRYDHFAA